MKVAIIESINFEFKEVHDGMTCIAFRNKEEFGPTTILPLNRLISPEGRVREERILINEIRHGSTEMNGSGEHVVKEHSNYIAIKNEAAKQAKEIGIDGVFDFSRINRLEGLLTNKEILNSRNNIKEQKLRNLVWYKRIAALYRKYFKGDR